MSYYRLAKSDYYQKFELKLDISDLPFPHGTAGSYNVLAARVLGLSYPDYLRYCRDRLGAELVGRNNLYVIPLFESNATTNKFVELLNNSLRYIMKEQKDPYIYYKENGMVKREAIYNDN